jgi:hypothetical protein
MKVHFELIFAQDKRHGSSFGFLQTDRYSVFPETFIEEAVFSPLYISGTSVKNKVGVAAWSHIWIFYSVPLVFVSVFVPVPCCLYCYGSVVYFEVGYCDTSGVALFAQYCLGYSQSFFLFLCFQMNFRVDFSISIDECHCILNAFNM